MSEKKCPECGSVKINDEIAAGLFFCRSCGLIFLKPLDEEPEVMPNCIHNSITLDFNTKEYVCEDCGQIVAQRYVPPTYEMDPKGYLYSDTKKWSKHYVALADKLRLIKSLGGFIGLEHSCVLKDFDGVPIPKKLQKKYKRLQYHDEKAKRAEKEREYQAISILLQAVPKLKLSQEIRNRATYYYNKIIISKEKITNHILLIAACLNFVVRERESLSHMTTQDIASVFEDLGGKVSVQAMNALDLKLRPKFEILRRRIRRSEDDVSRIISNVVKNPKVQSRLKNYSIDPTIYKKELTIQTRIILNNIDVKKRGGRNPYIFTVATVYAANRMLSSKLNFHSILTQKILSEATNCAEYSIRDHWRGILYDYLKKVS